MIDDEGHEKAFGVVGGGGGEFAAGNNLRLPDVGKLVFEMWDAFEDVERDPAGDEDGEGAENQGEMIGTTS